MTVRIVLRLLTPFCFTDHKLENVGPLLVDYLHMRSLWYCPFKAEVWDFPVITERTRLISYLLYGLFSAILKKNTIKIPEVIFHIRLRALRLSSSLILKKYLYASFSFSYWKYSCTLFIVSVVFAQVHVVLLTIQKSRRAEKNFIMPGHYLALINWAGGLYGRILAES